MKTKDNSVVNDFISKKTIRNLSVNIKTLNETVKSQENATGSDDSCN